MRNQQTSFEHLPAFRDHRGRFEHGGDIRVGKRKLYRPFDSTKTVHLTLRSTKAKGQWSFLRTKNDKEIRRLIFKYSDKFSVRIYNFANSGNHLHLLVGAKSKISFQRFLRTISGMIPRAVTQARKGKALGKFWNKPAYSKLVSLGRQFKNTHKYIFKNTLEALGFVPDHRMEFYPPQVNSP